MEEPNTNNLEQFNQVSTGSVPQNLNPEAWVSRQFDTLGGLQSFSTLTQLCNFHPNKMFLYMEANVGAQSKYRLINKPTLADFPLSQNTNDTNYFLNFWESKAVDSVQKRDNLFGGVGLSGGTGNYFKIADVNTVLTGDKANLKLHIITNFGNSGSLDIIATLNSIGTLIVDLSKLSYTENNITSLDGLDFYVRGSSNKFQLWVRINTGNNTNSLSYSVISDNATNDPWVFYENSNSATTTPPSGLVQVLKYKYSSDTVQDIRVSNNTLQQRSNQQEGGTSAYVDKSPLITTLSIDKSGNQYLRPVINGQASLINLFPIIDSRINSTSNLISTRLRNSLSTNTGLSTSSVIQSSFLINNPSSRDRVAIINYECVIERDDGGNEIFDLGIRSGLSSGAVSPTTGIERNVNRFIINASSLHQRTSICYVTIPANTTYYFCAYARIVSGGNARFHGPVKYSHVLL